VLSFAAGFFSGFFAAAFVGRFSFGFSNGSDLGSAASSRNASFEPTARFSTTPGRAIVAITMAGSFVSFAKPWVNRLCAPPHASSAAFMDGAATARSKKPIEVT